ncbi:MAG TPA: hypothetical protein VGZ25_03625 [Gemmataceae bacterium]|jgi:hypothetical protein|nr:hypothetical protein [Gemmataceae bacterium]
MANVMGHFLEDQLALADALLERRSQMFSPQDLPGRYGRVVMAVDHLLEVVDCEAVLAGGWAVWHHGYIGRVTQDLDIVLAAESVDSLMRAASVSGFEILAPKPGRWPKLLHKETNIQLDILPEGARPGVASKLAPTTIPHPAKMGGSGRILNYISLPSLIELKLAAGRARDEADVVELIRVNPEHLDAIRLHLNSVHSHYLEHFNQLVERAREQGEE